MDWFGSASWGARAELGDLTRRQRSLRRKINGQRRERAASDARLEGRLQAIEKDQMELMMCLTSLMEVLVNKGVISDEERLAVAEIAQDERELSELELLDEAPDELGG